MLSRQRQVQHRRGLITSGRTSAHQLFWFHIFLFSLLWASFSDVQRAFDALLLKQAAREGPCRLHQIRAKNGPREIGGRGSLRTAGAGDHHAEVAAKFGLFGSAEGDVKLTFSEPGVIECDNVSSDLSDRVCCRKIASRLPCEFLKLCCEKNSSIAETRVCVLNVRFRNFRNVVYLTSAVTDDRNAAACEWFPLVPRWPAYDGRGNLIGLLRQKLRSLLIPELLQDLDRAAPMPCVKDLPGRSHPDEGTEKLGTMMRGAGVQAPGNSPVKERCCGSKSLRPVLNYEPSCSILLNHGVRYSSKKNRNRNALCNSTISCRLISVLPLQASYFGSARRRLKPDFDEQTKKNIHSYPADDYSHLLSASPDPQRFIYFMPRSRFIGIRLPRSSSFLIQNQIISEFSSRKSVLLGAQKLLSQSKFGILPSPKVEKQPKYEGQGIVADQGTAEAFSCASISPPPPRVSVMVAAAQPSYTTERHIFTGFTTTQPPPTPPPPDFSIVAKEECGRSFCLFLIAYNKSFNFSRITLEYRDGDTANLTISLKLNITTGVMGSNYFGAKERRRGFVYNLRGLSGRRRYYVCARGYPLNAAKHGIKTSCESFMTSDTDGETDMYNLTGIFLVLGISTIIMTVVLLCVGYEKLIDRKKDECVDILLCRYKRKKTDKRPARGTISPEPLVVPHNNVRNAPQAYDNDTVSLSSTEDRRY